jgi:LmbE family N-acetylglucosaminyl deacetylase
MAIKTSILKFVQIIWWSIDCCICRGKIKKRRLSNVPDGKLFVLMPHSDDEWIGCSQLLMNHSANVIVINMDMPGGDNNSLHVARREEAESIANKYSYKIVSIEGVNKENKLSRLIKEYDPSCVFLPSFCDWHDEHFEVMNLFSDAADESDYRGEVGLYQVSIPIPQQLINAGFVMTKKQLKNKWSQFRKYYLTQNNIPCFRFAVNEIINGGICSQYAVEAYAIQNYPEWKANYQKFCLTDTEKKSLRENVNRISIIRNMCVNYSSRISC